MEISTDLNMVSLSCGSAALSICLMEKQRVNGQQDTELSIQLLSKTVYWPVVMEDTLQDGKLTLLCFYFNL